MTASKEPELICSTVTYSIQKHPLGFLTSETIPFQLTSLNAKNFRIFLTLFFQAQ